MAYLKSIIFLFVFLNGTLIFGQNAPDPLLDKEFEIKYFGRVTWFNAHLSCLACGGQLASIESEAEHNYVEGLIHDLGLQNVSFWIAGTDLANEGIFNWFTTGDLIRYSNFSPGQPDNHNGIEHCLVLWGARQLQWHDTVCNNVAFLFVKRNRNVILKNNGEFR